MKTALVTGAGRARGMGAAVARALGAEGWNVVATDRAGDWAGGFLRADLEDPEAAPALFDAAGPVSALVCLHARSENGGILDTPDEEMERHFRVNALGTFRLCREFVQRWPGGPGGRILCFTSGIPLGGEIAYACSKGALERLVLSLAAEVALRGITVNAVEPGPVDTGWMGEEVRHRIVAASPLGTAGAPDDVAGLVAFLCSRKADRITGQVVRCDGGWSTLR